MEIVKKTIQEFKELGFSKGTMMDNTLIYHCGSKLSSRDKMIYLFFISRAFQFKRVYVSYEFVTECTGYKETAIRESLKNLKELGFLEYSREGYNKPNTYEVYAIMLESFFENNKKDKR